MKDKPVDRDVDRMREMLARTPPADRGAAGRADAVVDRARRRRSRKRRGVVGALAVGTFAAVVIVTPHLLRTSPTTNDATDPTNGAEVAHPTAGPDPWLTDPCPVNPIDISEADSVQDLPTGAESVRLCRAVMPHVLGSNGKQDLVSSWDAPPDALVKDPDGFVRAVVAAPTWDAGECAAADWVDDPFAIVVTYADETRVIGSRAQVCNGITIGGRRIGSDSVIAAFVDGLEIQGSSLGEPTPIPPTCGTVRGQKVSTFDVDQISGPAKTGVACYTVDPQGPREYTDDEGLLTDDQVAALQDDIRANPGEFSELGCQDTGPVRVIRLVDGRGNVTAWVDDRCSGDFTGPAGIWSPSVAAEQIIADALGGRAD